MNNIKFIEVRKRNGEEFSFGLEKNIPRNAIEGYVITFEWESTIKNWFFVYRIKSLHSLKSREHRREELEEVKNDE